MALAAVEVLAHRLEECRLVDTQERAPLRQGQALPELRERARPVRARKMRTAKAGRGKSTAKKDSMAAPRCQGQTVQNCGRERGWGKQ